MNEAINTEIEFPLKKKHITRTRAAKHTYRTRTGPNCCTANCPAKGPEKKYPYYNNRTRKRVIG